MAWLYLALAIGSEVFGTLWLRALADGFRWPVVLAVVVGYLVSFAMMGLALRELSVATVYAIWSAIGTAAVAMLGAVLFSERLTWVAVAGIVLITCGVTLVTVSGSTAHG